MKKTLLIILAMSTILASTVHAQPNVFPGAGGAAMPNFAPRPFALPPRWRGGFTGGFQNQNLEDEEVRARAQELAQFVADQKTLEEQTPYVVSKITSYSVQQVNGKNHRLQLQLTDGNEDTFATATVHQPRNGPYRLDSYFSFKLNL